MCIVMPRPCWVPQFALAVALLIGVGCQRRADEEHVQAGRLPMPESYHVYPGDDIQAVVDTAARTLQDRPAHIVTVWLHEGTYRPQQPGQALIHFNRHHDGITLEGQGNVVLTAENEAIAHREAASFPAIVNHVVFFGDGISSRTVLRHVTITGANGFAADDQSSPSIEPDSDLPQLQKGLFYYLDGGGVKVFGRSSPTIDRVVMEANVAKLCGAGASIEQRGFNDQAVVFRNCTFRNNACPGTGSALDLLSGSAAEIENCLFVGNIANTGMDQIAAQYGLRYKPEHGCGALTVFPESRVTVTRCTFTGNWNGADDEGVGNAYVDSIFWHNTAGDGSRPGEPYELDIADARNVRGCYFGGPQVDLRGAIDPHLNRLDAPDPMFDMLFQPQADDYQRVGFRESPPHSPPVVKESSDES